MLVEILKLQEILIVFANHEHVLKIVNTLGKSLKYLEESETIGEI